MKRGNFLLAAFSVLVFVLALLIVVKLTSGIEKPVQRKVRAADNTAVQKNTSPKTGSTEKTPDTAVLGKDENSVSDRDAKIQKLIDELSNMNAKQPMIPQTEGIIRELCDFGDAVIPAISKLLASDAKASVKSPAARVLAQIGSAESVETLVNFIDSESDPVCKDLYIRSIQAVDKADASPSLIKALESSKDIYFSSEVKQAIARTGTEDTVKQLVDACHNQNEMNVQMSNLLGALSIVRQPETVPSISNVAANDQNPQIRKSALQALAGMGYPSATQALVDIFKSEQNADSKPLILDAIARINNKESLDCLHEIYNNKNNPEDLRKVAARAIFTIKNGTAPAE
ncbi:MAG: HEAT repeat domain-containing protein [Lentisphaerae bacterium]|nr:HEAT repeat domain-containing protein [Lentisphaerota bacterium]